MGRHQRNQGARRFWLATAKLLVFLALALAGWWVWRDQLFVQLDLDWAKSQRDNFQALYQQNPVETWWVFFLVYLLASAFALPGTVWLTLLVGALFGFWPGLLLVSLASTLGATAAFGTSRFLLGNLLSRRFPEKARLVNQGIKRDGVFYLFSLRLIPLFPFFLVNLLMGLTALPWWTFFWVSQLGMLPGTALYILAGQELGQLQSLEQVVSPHLLGALTLLGLFPWVAKGAIGYWRVKKLYRPFDRPRPFDYDLIAIGAGSAGLVSSYLGAILGAKVALVEAHKMGGDCLNTGCVPSKSLIKTANLVHQARKTAPLGLAPSLSAVDFKAVMASVKEKIATVAPHDSVERYHKLGVEVFRGRGRLLDPFRVQVGDRVLTGRNLILATGARPRLPDLPGLELVPSLTSETLWDLTELPPRLLVIGGGPIGCEMAQAFARLGSQVTLLQRSRRLLPKEDPEVSALLAQQLEEEGVTLRMAYLPLRFEAQAGEYGLVAQGPQEEVWIGFDQVLFAVGRVPNTEGLGLEELGIELGKEGQIQTDRFLATKFPNILAAGDVQGRFQFTHTASLQAGFAALNGLFWPLKSFAPDYRVIPWATFTDPEVARVGVNETLARELGLEFEVTCFDLKELDRAITEGEQKGFVKLLTAKGKDQILGVTAVGPHAGEWIGEWVLGMKHHLGVKGIFNSPHIYPTLAEANKAVAARWQQDHTPAWVIGLFSRWFAWTRHF